MNFDDKFFASVGLGNANDEKRAVLVNKLAKLIQGRLALRLGSELSDEQLEKFDQLMEGGDDQAAFDHLSQVYPKFNEVLQAEINVAKEELTRGVETVTEKLKQ